MSWLLIRESSLPYLLILFTHTVNELLFKTNSLKNWHIEFDFSLLFKAGCKDRNT